MESNKLFKACEIFNVDRGTRLIATKREKGSFPLVTAGFSNQGVSEFISNEENKTFKLSFTIDMFGNVFPRNYSYKSDDNIHIIDNSFVNESNVFYLSTSVAKSIENIYSYGKQFRLKSFQKLNLLLPAQADGTPDYAYMEAYSKKLYQQKQDEYLAYIQNHVAQLANMPKPIALEEKEWEVFKTTTVFDKIQRGKRLKKDDHIIGEVPYASSTSLNNGIDGFIGNEVGVRIFDNCLTLANSGSVGCTFYQPFKVIASDHVTMLKNHDFNKYIYLFLASVLTRLNEKYSFNREINDTRLSKEKVLLPITKDGSPDYKYMEQYMKYQEYQKLMQYLEFKKK